MSTRSLDRRTALHDRHVAAGARMDRSGSWLRPGTYGDAAEEYQAVRERVSLMDVSTLGKFLVAGRDAVALLDRVFPSSACTAPGRARYLLALDEAGYVMDDGLLEALPEGRYYLTSTSGGADRMEAWLRNWADRRDSAYIWRTTPRRSGRSTLRARTLSTSSSACPTATVYPRAIPYPGHADIAVAGVPCRALAVGFVGELSFELHHPRCGAGALGRAAARRPHLGLRPHGLDALDVLRLEKGHLYLGQDTLPDDHPEKLGLGFAVAMDKGPFVGRARWRGWPTFPERQLVGLTFDGTPQRGMPLTATDAWSDGSPRAPGRRPASALSVSGGSARSTAASRPRSTPATSRPPSYPRRSTTPKGRGSVPELRAAKFDVVDLPCHAGIMRRRDGHRRRLPGGADEVMVVGQPGTAAGLVGESPTVGVEHMPWSSTRPTGGRRGPRGSDAGLAFSHLSELELPRGRLRARGRRPSPRRC